MVGLYYENYKLFYFDDGEFNKDDLGKMVTGWRAIKEPDGFYYYYYFNEDGINETLGAMLTSGKTKDGWTVDLHGRWTVDEVVQKFTLSDLLKKW